MAMKETDAQRTILAIDPGPVKSAWVMWDGEKVKQCGLDDNDGVLMALYGSPKSYRHVIEMIASYGMAVGKEVFETCLWIGRFVESTDGHAELIYRKDVKMHLCHSMRAKDTNIRQALIDRFGPVGTKKAPGTLYGLKKDMWSAMALAVTAYDKAEIVKGKL